MHKMDTDYETSELQETNYRHDGYHSDTEVVIGVNNKAFSQRRNARFIITDSDLGSSSGGWKSSGDDDKYVEVTLDVRDDSVAVHNLKSAGGADVEDAELTPSEKGLEKRSSSLEPNASARIRQVSEELKRFTSFSKRQPVGRLDRRKSAADQAFKGLKFISKHHRSSWMDVWKRFDELTLETKGFLPRSRFGECIGMDRDSKEFYGELFDSLSRQKNITGDSIDIAQFKEFWEQINDQSFDSRVQTFFDMVDKDADGRITEDELGQIIRISALANKLPNIGKQVEEYAAFIMEELDPFDMGYIMIESLEILLLQAPTHKVRDESQNFSHDHYDSDIEDPELTFFAEGLEKKSLFGSSVLRIASARIRQVSEECSHLYSASKRHLVGRLDRTSSSAAHAFMGLEFISPNEGMNKDSYGSISKEHATNTRMNLAVPIPPYARERLTRPFRSGTPVKILKVVLYPGNVLSLHMTKPQGFKYKSGQYMLVKCPDVSTFEWHPFSITAAPNDDYLSVHIRTLGNWTRQLKAVFSEACQPPPSGKSGLLRADRHEENPKFPRILINGPYSGQAQKYEKYEVVLLVSLGIGATPMISILKQIVNNMKEEEEDALEDGSTLQRNKLGNNLVKRAYFYWVTREQGSFEWFKGIINEAAEIDKNGVIEMHNYCTSIYEEGDARSALISMLQSLYHAKTGVDVVSGTRVKSHFGKPNWRDVYERIANNHQGSRIGVFYCGAPTPGKELKQLALDFSQKTSTKFDFHKERF